MCLIKQLEEKLQEMDIARANKEIYDQELWDTNYKSLTRQLSIAKQNAGERIMKKISKIIK